MNQYEKIDYTQHPGVLHKNEKGEWGMYKEHFKNCTGVYWQPASKHQLENIYLFDRTVLRHIKNLYNKRPHCILNT